MKVPSTYRGIEYSVSEKANGRWQWKLHPPLEPGVFSPIIHGEVIGTQDDAIAAAEAAIDKLNPTSTVDPA